MRSSTLQQQQPGIRIETGATACGRSVDTRRGTVDAACLKTCLSCSNGCCIKVIIGNLDTRRGKEGVVIALHGQLYFPPFVVERFFEGSRLLRNRGACLGRAYS